MRPTLLVLAPALTALLTLACRSGAERTAERPPEPASGRVASAGSLSVPRAAHTATALPDGGVLIAGGCTEDSCEPGDGSATFEVWKDGTSEQGRLTGPRIGQTATLLPGGRVLLAGGWAGDAVTASTEVVDPASRTSSPAVAMSLARSGHSATPLPDGTVLFAGGMDGRAPLDLAEVFDPARGTFSPVADMAVRRFKLQDAVVALRTGQVLVGGGGPSAELFDPGSGSFRPAEGSLGSGWSFAAAALLPDGSVLVTGGYDERIRITAGMWRYWPG